MATNRALRRSRIRWFGEFGFGRCLGGWGTFEGRGQGDLDRMPRAWREPHLLAVFVRRRLLRFLYSFCHHSLLVCLAPLLGVLEDWGNRLGGLLGLFGLIPFLCRAPALFLALCLAPALFLLHVLVLADLVSAGGWGLGVG